MILFKHYTIFETVFFERIMDPHTDEFTVTLLSNSSYDIYPKNTVFDFTNILARTLHFPPCEKWRVCLQSISVTTASDDPEVRSQRNLLHRQAEIFKTGFIRARQNLVNEGTILGEAMKMLNYQSQLIFKKRVELFNKTNTLFVECPQIVPKFGTKPYISTFLLPPEEKIKGEFITYEPQTEEYFNLVSPEISQFDIKILNPKGDKIYRSVAQPSIVVLKFKKMEDIRKSYTINISNGTQSPTHFYTTFPNMLVENGFQNPWEMAVTRISFIPLFKKFPSNTFSITIVLDADDYYPKFTVQTWDAYLTTKTTEKIDFQYNEDHTTDDLIRTISTLIGTICQRHNLNGSMTRNEKNTLSIKIHPKDQTPNQEDKIYLLILPEELIYVLGFDNDGIHFKDGYGAIPGAYDKTMLARRKVNEQFLIPQNLLLYSNCVEPSLVGNIYGRYLTHIPTPRESKSLLNLPYILYEPKNLEFHSLQGSDVNNILFQLLKTDGNEPEFLVDNIQIFISLILRERK